MACSVQAATVSAVGISPLYAGPSWGNRGRTCHVKKTFLKIGGPSDGQCLLQVLTVKDFSELINHIVNVFKVTVLQSYLLFN